MPEKLAALMSANKVSCEELQCVVGKRGYFPEDMPIKDYPADFVEGCLIAAWPQVFQMVLDNRDPVLTGSLTEGAGTCKRD